MISKKEAKIFKLFIISPLLERILIITYLITIPLLCFNEKYVENLPSPTMGKQFQAIMNTDRVVSIKMLSEVIDWLEEDVAVNIFTTSLNPNYQLTPIIIAISNFNKKDCDEENINNCIRTIDEIDLESFPANQRAIYKKKLEFGAYPMNIIATIGRSNNFTDPKFLSYLHNDNLIGENTEAIAIAGFYKNQWSNAILEYEIAFEIGLSNRVLDKSISYKVQHLDVQNSPEYLALVCTFLFQIILFSLKVLFESSFIPSKIMIFIYITFAGFEIAFALTYFIEYWGYTHFSFIYSEDINHFLSLKEIFDLSEKTDLLLAILALFIPFRFFTLISWIKYLQPINRFWSTAYRAFPTISLHIFISVILIVSWSMSSFLIFNEYLYQSKTLLSTILTFFTFDINMLSSPSVDSLNTSLGVFSYIFLWLQASLALLLVVIFACLLINLIRRSSELELEENSTYEIEQIEKASEINTKFDRLLKEVTLIVNLKKSSGEQYKILNQEKMIIWLDCNKGKWIDETEALFEKLKNENIKIMIFHTPEEVEEFLKYLFSLKPNLLTSKAGSIFRIVVENYIKGRTYDLIYIEILVDWLRMMGCRIPLYIHSKIILAKEDIMHIRKLYSTLLIGYDKQQLLKYCLMKIQLDAFNKNQDFDIYSIIDSDEPLSLNTTQYAQDNV